jgi:hypothetical protein
VLLSVTLLERWAKGASQISGDGQMRRKKFDTRNYGKFHPRFAEGGEVDDESGGDEYNTPLDQGEEEKFQAWKAQKAPKDSGYDYDLRGAYKAGVEPDPEDGHWPDTYKKPNHPTFSDESRYATGANAAKAGHWKGKKFIPPGEDD